MCADSEVAIKPQEATQMELFPEIPGGKKRGRPRSGVPRDEQLRLAAKRYYQKKKAAAAA